MQNKHFFPFWEPQRWGSWGGGSSRMGENPNFYRNLFWMLPLPGFASLNQNTKRQKVTFPTNQNTLKTEVTFLSMVIQRKTGLAWAGTSENFSTIKEQSKWTGFFPHPECIDKIFSHIWDNDGGSNFRAKRKFPLKNVTGKNKHDQWIPINQYHYYYL